MTPQEYLINHSLKEEFVTKQMDWVLEENKITIPINDIEGNHLYNKYRNLVGEAKFTADPGSHPVLYMIKNAIKYQDIILAEGEVDASRLWQEGIPTTTGTFGVSTFSEKFTKPLKDKNVYITLDTDEAGQKAIAKYIEVLTKIGAIPFIITLPSEYKDVSEYFTAGHTRQDFLKLKKEALSLDDYNLSKIPEEYELESGDKLMERPIPPEEWLIDRVLPTDGFTFIVGAEATGKSFYTLTLAHSVATGTPWLGKFKVSKQVNILFIDKENSDRRKKARIAGLNIKPEELKNIYWVKYPQFFQLQDQSKQGELSAFALHLSKEAERLNIGLIIIDSFADVMVGNENAVADCQQFFDAIRILFPGRAVLVLHHENKPSQGISRTSSQRVRGSTNITAQIVSGFRVFSIPKESNQFVLEQFKAGDSEKLKPFKVELVSKPNPYNPDKTYVSEVRHNGEYYDQEGQSDKAEELITDFLTENITSLRQDIIDYCTENGVGTRTVNTTLSDMVSNNVLEKIRTGQKVSYSLK